MTSKRKQALLRAGIALLVIVAVYAGRHVLPQSGTETVARTSIDKLFEQRRSKVWVEGDGVVAKLLRDDTVGSRHQQWLLRLESGLTVKFAHNIDLAERVPIAKGETIRFRGRYEYNAKGGVIHWTHHDPAGRLAGGWIEAAGKRYE